MYNEYFIISIILFILAVLGIILNRSNVIIMLMSIELMLLAMSFLFLINSEALDNLIGEVFTIMVLTVAAGEIAIGLAILVAYYRIKGTIAIKSLNLLRGWATFKIDPMGISLDGEYNVFSLFSFFLFFIGTKMKN
uniref:NADH-ubiquinone oxidoreductase chain 4L n=1 Tax=Plakina crypta TaxID=908212 RepID=E7DNF7_PLACY|nr:NADH dehydrogenase subunit 4L [Plakina crypta]ADO51374.1 NADH dehydrogenase subunit 4L [Plakina crypta]